MDKQTDNSLKGLRSTTLIDWFNDTSVFFKTNRPFRALIWLFVAYPTRLYCLSYRAWASYIGLTYRPKKTSTADNNLNVHMKRLHMAPIGLRVGLRNLNT